MWSSSPSPSTSLPTDSLLFPYLFDTLSVLDQHQYHQSINLKNDTFCSNSSTASHNSRCESPDSSSASTSLYSLKVFLGGLPRGTTKVQILLNLQKFGVVNVEMQGVHGGYCFVIFKSQTCCQKFMQSCVTGDANADRFYYPFNSDVFSSRKTMIEVKPFKLVDAHYGMCMNSMEATNDQTIFVGGIPRDTTAETLAMKLEARFGGVSEVSIDLDSDTMYPRGTAMVIFKEKTSARKAVASQILVMKQGKKYRLVELKPFLEVDKPCSICEAVGPAVFCAECKMVMGNCCWNAQHINAMHHKKVGRGTFYTIRCC